MGQTTPKRRNPPGGSPSSTSSAPRRSPERSGSHGGRRVRSDKRRTTRSSSAVTIRSISTRSGDCASGPRWTMPRPSSTASGCSPGPPLAGGTRPAQGGLGRRRAHGGIRRRARRVARRPAAGRRCGHGPRRRGGISSGSPPGTRDDDRGRDPPCGRRRATGDAILIELRTSTRRTACDSIRRALRGRPDPSRASRPAASCRRGTRRAGPPRRPDVGRRTAAS